MDQPVGLSFMRHRVRIESIVSKFDFSLKLWIIFAICNILLFCLCATMWDGQYCVNNDFC